MTQCRGGVSRDVTRCNTGCGLWCPVALKLSTRIRTRRAADNERSRVTVCMTRHTDSRQSENRCENNDCEDNGDDAWSECDDGPGEQCELSVFDSVRSHVPSERLTAHREADADGEEGCVGEGDGTVQDRGGESDA